MDYLITLKAYVGLTHGARRHHYSLREYHRVLSESRLRQAPFTLITALGQESGAEEDVGILELDHRFQTASDLQRLCDQLNDFFSRIFKELDQRWIHITYLVSRQGVPVKHSTLDLMRDEKTRIEAPDVFAFPPA